MDNNIKSAIKQRVSKNPDEVLKILKSAGVQLSQTEESEIKSGRLDLDKFSDKQLDERFNAKVLGMMGIMMQGRKMSGGSSSSSSNSSSSSSSSGGRGSSEL